MNQFFLYPIQYKDSTNDGRYISATVIFFESDIGQSKNLSAEIRRYFETHTQTDQVFVIGAQIYGAGMVKAFNEDIEETYRYVPKSNYENLRTNTSIFTFDENGSLSHRYGENWKGGRGIPGNLLNEGLLTIFKERGGLIEANEGYHYVFPSGKHCSKFLRTGNVLLHSAEVYFLAFTLLSHFVPERHSNIFCDSSSINLLAFALQDLKRQLVEAKAEKFKLVPIESFSSYDGLVKADGKRLERSLILISASTSANILQRINKYHPIVKQEDIKVLYYLGPEDIFNEKRANILCNLTKSTENPNGIDIYTTYHSSECELCKRGSYPAKINGDVFLPENPKVELVSLTAKDAPDKMSEFMEAFQAANQSQDNFLKVNYKENSSQDLQYEVYMDINYVITSIQAGGTRYSRFKEKLDAYIHQYVPSNVRYLVCLPDEGSYNLAIYICSMIERNYKDDRQPGILRFNEISQIAQGESGSILIVASCISNGKNMLSLSREFRLYEELKLVYFVGISRMSNEDQMTFLKSNLTYGKYGVETYAFHAIETLYCSNEVKDTAWARETAFMKRFQEFAEGKDCSQEFYNEIQSRIRVLEKSISKSSKGLANELFFPAFATKMPLRLRKNYAFLKYSHYHDNLSQADVYFTINTIIHKLRNSKSSKSLRQAEYYRNLISPINFNRFNDGIIQASLLRSCRVTELSYHINSSASLEMKGILETLMKNFRSDQSEALLEFLYAIASKQLTLIDEHLYLICELAKKELVEFPWVNYLVSYIEAYVLPDFVDFISQKQQINSLEEELRKLKEDKRILGTIN